MNTSSYTAASTLPAKLFCDNTIIDAIRSHKIFPVHVQVNLTNACPLNCSFCSCAKRDKTLEMSIDDAKMMAEKFISLGTKAFTNSIRGNETILLEKDGYISIKTIEDVVDNFNNFKGFKSWSCENEKIILDDIVNVFKHKTDVLYNIVLESGKSLYVTGNHSLYFYENKKIICKKVEEINIGEQIITCSVKPEIKNRSFIETLTFNNFTRRGTENPGRVEITKDLCRLLGYFVAEGSFIKEYTTVFTFGKYCGQEKKYIDDAMAILFQMGFSNNTTINKTEISKTTIFVHSMWFTQTLQSLGIGKKSRLKRVPDIIFNVDQDLKIEFLKGLFAGDGTFRNTISKKSFKRNVLNLKTSSNIMCKTLGFLFDALEIFYTINYGINKKRAIEGRALKESDYYTVNISRKNDLLLLSDIIKHMGKELNYTVSKYSCYTPNIKKVVISDNISAYKIKKIKKIACDEYVYDIEIKNSHKFITSFGILAHNTGGGDPLCYKPLPSYLNFLHEHKVDSALVTNGVLFNKFDLEVLNVLTWCRISLSDDRNFRPVEIEEAIKQKTDWSFSYVLSQPNPNVANIIKSIDFANEQEFTHVRVVDDILDPDSFNRIDLLKEILEKSKVDTSKVIWQGRKNYTVGHKRCLLSLLKPNVTPDGLLNGCCGLQYASNPPMLDWPRFYSMGTIHEIDRIYEEQRYWDGSKCLKCFYNNDVLNAIWDSPKLKHIKFV